MTAREWLERAKETLDEYTRISDDARVLDAFDDICNALEALDAERLEGNT